jgi:alpha-D-ribose 1-methylphosphonate 5-triphosphate synthase subunit PhnH
MTPSSTAALAFADPVLESQRVFRQVLQAMSRPGIQVATAAALETPAPLFASTTAIALTLFDLDTPVWLDSGASTPATRGYLGFHCGCPIVDARRDAAFAILVDPAGLGGLAEFSPGEPEFPDRSATLVVQVPAFGRGRSFTFRGPGIDGTAEIAIDGLPPGFDGAWADNHALFPEGVDLILASPGAVVGLPRSIRVEG